MVSRKLKTMLGKNKPVSKKLNVMLGKNKPVSKKLNVRLRKTNNPSFNQFAKQTADPQLIYNFSEKDLNIFSNKPRKKRKR